MSSPTSRLLELLELLQARPVVTGREIAERLGVDARTVRRYLTVLQELGIPVEGQRGVGGGYRMRPGYRLQPAHGFTFVRLGDAYGGAPHPNGRWHFTLFIASGDILHCEPPKLPCEPCPVCEPPSLAWDPFPNCEPPLPPWPWLP